MNLLLVTTKGHASVGDGLETLAFIFFVCFVLWAFVVHDDDCDDDR